MGYRNLTECVVDLERHGMLRRIDAEIDPRLEMAEIQRRVYRAGGPALLFNRPKGCRFPMLSNLFGTLERTRWIFRDTLRRMEHIMRLKGDPAWAWRRPWSTMGVPLAGFHALPRVGWSGASSRHEVKLSDLPGLVSWPGDGGPYVTLPLVYSESPVRPGWMKSNLGMYRVQLAGAHHEPDREVGLHYQIHRGIGVHHSEAIARGESLRVAIWVGGPPALTVSAVMPLPEGVPEVAFAGALAGRGIWYHRPRDSRGMAMRLLVPSQADFCIVGTVDGRSTKPEGPFGDHLGYYSLKHDFPVMRVERVTHRPGAIWPFTVVGRPPQEDTSFGEFIHELAAPVLPAVLPGVRSVHAVDAAGVHPLLLAVGSERYVPYARERTPQELLTQAFAILGQGQLSLAKYLLIVAGDDDPSLRADDIDGLFRHLLCRADWRRDAHVITRTTIDTLDYSGDGLNSGSKVILAAAGAPRRQLPVAMDSTVSWPEGWGAPRVCAPGVLALRGPAWEQAGSGGHADARRLALSLGLDHPVNRFPLVLLVDDSDFVSASRENWLWAAFTRSNPAADLHGIGEMIIDKHWGCAGSLMIDARRKPHHAPPLVEDPEVTRRVEDMAVRGGPLEGLL
ncbi:MAG: UbiD family decarboxylase [Planctomycetes bacterium]|nr:UbiD family decarboxylase [Planctomycetota bacterium]